MSDTYARVGGLRMVHLRGGGLVRADLEITAVSEEHYRRASELLAKQIERGRAPWMIRRDPDHALPESLSGRPETGPNAVWLSAAADSRGYSDPRWDTEEAIEREGGKVRPGEKDTTALHWRFAGKDERTGETWATRVFRVPVYNAQQCEGLPDYDVGGTGWSHHPSPGKILAVPEVELSAVGRARYDFARDRIELPDPDRFADRQAYHRTAIHEVGHWTGHPSRLNRATLAQGVAEGHGSRAYALEELRAEIHSYLTGSRMGLGHDPSRHARFGGEWAAALREDPREIYRAAHSAERISRYVTARMPEMQPARQATPAIRETGRPLPVPGRDPGRGR